MAAAKRKTATPGKAKSAAKPATSRRRSSSTQSGTPRGAASRWSHGVTEHSNAMTLDRNVFTLDDPRKIAASLKRSSERSKRRKADPYRSAMSMLTFYINRAGSNLSAERKHTLERAKDELRKLFGKD